MSEGGVDAHRRGRRDVIAAVILFAVCAAAFGSIKTTPYIEADYYLPDPGPSFLPYILLAGLLVVTVLLGISGAREMWAHRINATPLLSRAALAPWLVPIAMVGSLLILFALTTRFGFLFGAIPFAAIWSVFLAKRDGRSESARSTTLHVLAGIASVGVVYLVFMRLIGVPLA